MLLLALHEFEFLSSILVGVTWGFLNFLLCAAGYIRSLDKLRFRQDKARVIRHTGFYFLIGSGFGHLEHDFIALEHGRCPGRVVAGELGRAQHLQRTLLCPLQGLLRFLRHAGLCVEP